MFTRSELSRLLSSAPSLGASIFLPTHVLGREVRQGPIRLKNLAAEACNQLVSAGLDQAEAEAFVEPATMLVDDYGFWQHQSQGLAVFLDGEQPRHFKVPIPLPERVAVGPGFHVMPLLPLLAADGAFLVLTITADKVALYAGSRFELAEDETADLPRSIGDLPGEPDYENPVQASPVARPNTGTINVSNAQVYGDSPADWSKIRRVEFVRRVATGLNDHVAANPVPVVVVADTELAGHFQKLSSLGPRLIGVVDVNPESLDPARLHEVTYAVVQPHLDERRNEALERFQALSGGGDPRAATAVEEVVRAAYAGRVDTLLLAEDRAVSGRYDQAVDRFAEGESFATAGGDLLEAAAVQTLQSGGDVHLTNQDEALGGHPCGAILRY